MTKIIALATQLFLALIASCNHLSLLNQLSVPPAKQSLLLYLCNKFDNWISQYCCGCCQVYQIDSTSRSRRWLIFVPECLSIGQLLFLNGPGRKTARKRMKYILRR